MGLGGGQGGQFALPPLQVTQVDNKQKWLRKDSLDTLLN